MGMLMDFPFFKFLSQAIDVPFNASCVESII